MRHPLDFWRNPRADWSDWSKAMDRFFEDINRPALRTPGKELAFAPTCDVSEDANHYHFKFDLPGISKDQVKIEIHQNQLTVSGERKEERKEDKKRYHVSEVNYGSFMRTFALPANIDAEKVEAKFENGVLMVNVAKTETSKSREVNIK